MNDPNTTQAKQGPALKQLLAGRSGGLFSGRWLWLAGALLAGAEAAPAAGFLTSVRDVRWQRRRLDELAGDLTIRAERISGNEVNILYRFSVHGDSAKLLCGRASVMLKEGNP